MRAVIIGNGSIYAPEKVRSRLMAGDFIICADAAENAARLGVAPDIAMGDFDSSAPPEGTEVIAFPVKKDYTDGELALAYAAERGFDEILLLGMTGGKRVDHLLSNILMLTRYPGAYMADETNEIYILRGRLELSGRKGMTLSIIPIGGDLNGVCARGFEWELEDAYMEFGAGRGISNVITSDISVITAKSGIAAIVINNGE